jgi:hypothetical protein
VFEHSTLIATRPLFAMSLDTYKVSLNASHLQAAMLILM